MAADLISKRTRDAFEDWFSGNSTLREISRYFSNREVAYKEHPEHLTYGGERRTLVNNYYQPTDWKSPSDCEKILQVFEDVLQDFTSKDSWHTPDEKSNLIRSLTNPLLADGYPFENGKIIRKTDIIFDDLHQATDILDTAYFHQHTSRIKKSVAEDPSLAIGSTKELIESVLKTILSKLEIGYEKDDDIPKLLKAVQKSLNLLPKEVDDSVKGAEIIRVLLSNLSQVVIKLTELRNLYGTGHGKENSNTGIQPRHARLAVHSGIALSTFLLETFDYQTSK